MSPALTSIIWTKSTPTTLSFAGLGVRTGIYDTLEVVIIPLDASTATPGNVTLAASDGGAGIVGELTPRSEYSLQYRAVACNVTGLLVTADTTTETG